MAGLVHALALDAEHDVTVLEHTNRCGGLLDSYRDRGGATFDQGTHILSETGRPELDQVLFGSLSRHDWRRMAFIRAGNWFRGHLNRSSLYVDARRLPEATYRRGLDELTRADPIPRGEDLTAFLRSKFGATFAEHVQGPVLRKHLGVGSDGLLPDDPFAHPRLICFEAEEARRLKQDSFWDARIAFHSNREGPGETGHWYPRAGGTGAWIAHALERLAARGAKVRTGAEVASVRTSKGGVEVRCGDNGTLNADRLVWTAPASTLLRVLGVEAPAARPHARPVLLHHIVFDRPFLVENDYVTDYDEEHLTFRVTLYPNLRDAPNEPPHNCTVETLEPLGSPPPDSLARVVQELVAIGIVGRNAHVVRSEVHRVPMGFPAISRGAAEALARQTAMVRRALPDVVLLGRAKLRPFFMTDVLGEAFEAARECRVEA